MYQQRMRNSRLLNDCNFIPYANRASVTKESSIPTRGEIKRRPDLQSCRMVSGSCTYGKDRSASSASQDYVEYGDITRDKEFHTYRRLDSESNVYELKINRYTGDSTAPFHIGNKKSPSGFTIDKPQHGGIGSCFGTEQQLSSPEQFSQNYSVIPNSGNISSVCKLCG